MNLLLVGRRCCAAQILKGAIKAAQQRRPTRFMGQGQVLNDYRLVVFGRKKSWGKSVDSGMIHSDQPWELVAQPAVVHWRKSELASISMAAS
jgi:hypothetical protein